MINTLLITLSVYVVTEVLVSFDKDVTCRCHNLIRDDFPSKLPLFVNHVCELYSTSSLAPVSTLEEAECERNVLNRLATTVTE